jgi:Rps23 Pro-64 3,4-dihydroxylase Tpa1-like proline 4-hydroxylase
MLDISSKVFSDFKSLQTEFENGDPFPHVIIDDFLDIKLARQIDEEFPPLSSDLWYKYKNAIEYKKTYNHWEAFPEATYKFFAYLSSDMFIAKLNQLMPGVKLYPDMGLNGGGWHAHGAGGKLNTHLDYSIHPKLGLERRLNIILYINENYDTNWGGSLGLWSHDADENQPKDLVKLVQPKFNRAVIFDTTCNSWHGLPEPINCPVNEARRSLALYYLSEPRKNISKRGKALFAPTEAQKGDESVLELIKERSKVKPTKKVYLG